MIEVTDELLQVLKDYCDFYISGADAIERIIELHEVNKPKPEPVVWVVWNGWKPVGVTLDEEKAITYAQSKQLHSDLSGDFNAYRVAPLYTKPPTPKREPLSDEQLATIITNAYRYDYTHYDLARAIEQAHGIGATND